MGWFCAELGHVWTFQAAGVMNSWATDRQSERILALLTSLCPGLFASALDWVWAPFMKNLQCFILLRHQCGQAPCLCGLQCLLSEYRSSIYQEFLVSGSVLSSSLYRHSLCSTIVRPELQLLQFFSDDIEPRKLRHSGLTCYHRTELQDTGSCNSSRWTASRSHRPLSQLGPGYSSHISWGCVENSPSILRPMGVCREPPVSLSPWRTSVIPPPPNF